MTYPGFVVGFVLGAACTTLAYLFLHYRTIKTIVLYREICERNAQTIKQYETACEAWESACLSAVEVSRRTLAVADQWQRLFSASDDPTSKPNTLN